MILGRCVQCASAPEPPADPILPVPAWVSKLCDLSSTSGSAAPESTQGSWTKIVGVQYTSDPRDRYEDAYIWVPGIPLVPGQQYLCPGLRFDPRPISSGQSMFAGGMGIREKGAVGGLSLWPDYYRGPRDDPWTYYNTYGVDLVLLHGLYNMRRGAGKRQEWLLHGGDTVSRSLTRTWRQSALYTGVPWWVAYHGFRSAMRTDYPTETVPAGRHTGGDLLGLTLPITTRWPIRLKYIRLLSNGSPVGDLIELPSVGTRSGMSLGGPPSLNYDTTGSGVTLANTSAVWDKVTPELASLTAADLHGTRVGLECYFSVCLPSYYYSPSDPECRDFMTYSPRVTAGHEMGDAQPRWGDQTTGVLGLWMSSNNIHFSERDAYTYRLTSGTTGVIWNMISETFGAEHGDWVAGDRWNAERVPVENIRSGQSLLLGDYGEGGCQMVRTVTVLGITVTVLITLSWNQRIPILVISWMKPEHILGYDPIHFNYGETNLTNPFTGGMPLAPALVYIPRGSPFVWYENSTPVADLSPWEAGGAYAGLNPLDRNDFTFYYRLQNGGDDWQADGTHEFDLLWNTQQSDTNSFPTRTSTTFPNTITVDRVSAVPGRQQDNLGWGMYWFIPGEGISPGLGTAAEDTGGY